MIKVVFQDGPEAVEVEARDGQSLLEVAHEAGIDLEGACGGQLACATCHIYVEGQWTKRLTKPKPDELDMLELAPHWRPKSRLGCQIKISAELDGLIVSLPPV